MLSQEEQADALRFEAKQVALQHAFDEESCVAGVRYMIESMREDGPPRRGRRPRAEDEERPTAADLLELEREAGNSLRAQAMVKAFRAGLQTTATPAFGVMPVGTDTTEQQETTMSKVKEHAEQAWDTLKDEGTEAAWNTVAIKAIDWGKGLVVGMAAKHIDPKDKTLKGKLTRALNTEGGAMVVSFALSGAVALFGSQVAPVLGIEQSRLSYLGERLRVMGMTKGGVAVVDGVLSQLKQKAGPLVMLLKAMPAMPSNGALPGSGSLRLSPDEAPVREKAR